MRTLQVRVDCLESRGQKRSISLDALLAPSADIEVVILHKSALSALANLCGAVEEGCPFTPSPCMQVPDIVVHGCPLHRAGS